MDQPCTSSISLYLELLRYFEAVTRHDVRLFAASRTLSGVSRTLWFVSPIDRFVIRPAISNIVVFQEFWFLVRPDCVSCKHWSHCCCCLLILSFDCLQYFPLLVTHGSDSAHYNPRFFYNTGSGTVSSSLDEGHGYQIGSQHIDLNTWYHVAWVFVDMSM